MRSSIFKKHEDTQGSPNIDKIGGLGKNDMDRMEEKQ